MRPNLPRTNLEYSGGGCALNTVRVFQWLSPSPNSAVFLGGLGKVGRYPLRMSSIGNGRMTAGPSLKASSTVTPFSLHLPNRSVRCTVYSVQCTRKKTKFAEIFQDDLPTGHCIALVEGAERTLAANLGAANKFSPEDLWQGNNRTLLEGAKVKHSSFHQVCLIISP